jgi:beta-1,4-mannosyltransferase
VQPRVLLCAAGHRYVRNIQGANDSVSTLIPALDWRRDAATILSIDWISTYLALFDIVHVQFGYNDCQTDDLRRFSNFLRNQGKRLIFTLHDLTNPQTEDQSHHAANTEALVEGATKVITLTAACADLIRDRYDINPVTIQHPHVLPLDRIGRPRARTESKTIAIHLKSLRPGVRDAAREIKSVVHAIRIDPTLRLRIDINDEADPAIERIPSLVAALEHLRGDPRVSILIHGRFSEREFDQYFYKVDVSVLPYSLGTHSGWAEACMDAGVAVLAPKTTLVPHQNEAVIAYDRTSSTDLTGRVLSAPGTQRAWTEDARRSQRERIWDAHCDLYLESMDIRG